MNWAAFHFIRPFWLMALLPWLVMLVLMLRKKLSRGNWASVCDVDLLPYLLQEKALNQSRWPLTIGAFAAFLTIVALAGPTWERLPAPVFRNDSALVIALDLSRSMDAEDIKPSRLIRARYKIADILKHRKDGQTALLVYAGEAFTVTPLTDDTETIASQLEALNTSIMPSQGSNTVAVLQKAVELFKQAGLQKGQIILITDEANVDGTLATVKALDGYSLSILGVGTVDGAPIAEPEGGFLKDRNGTIVVAKLNESDLIKLAQAGNGIYHALSPDDADIQHLVSILDKPVPSQGKENRNLLLDLWSDKGPWLLLPILPLAALKFRKGLFCWVLLLLVPLPKNSHALEWRDLWQTRNQQAQQAYNNQQFEQAAGLFDHPDWKAAAQYKAGHYDKALETLKNSQAANASYNRGNALAQSGHLQEALKAYEQALAESPGDEDARYNKDLVEKELKKQQQQEKQQQDNKQNSQDQQKNEQQSSDKDKDGQNKEQQEKSESPEEQNKSEQKDEKQSSESEKSSEQKQQEQQAEEKKQEEARQAQQAEPKANKDEKPTQQQTEPAVNQAKPTDEAKQANEQWLNRIPDDPAGLLKRKFRYQYGQRQHPSNSESGGW
ncbi:MAG: VWA domain-containing protein [Methylococcaceae bacterium]|nr:VWA domain-containing protein [Methylococcaceae bacterium]